MVTLTIYFFKSGKFVISSLILKLIPENYDWKGKFPIQYTCLHGNKSALKYFSKKVAFWSMLTDCTYETIYCCIEKGDMMMMEFICEKMIEQYDYHDEMSSKFIKSLLRSKLIKHGNYGYKYSPLHKACICGRLNFVKYFIGQIGFSPDHSNERNTSCLHIAVEHKHENIIKHFMHNYPRSLSYKDFLGRSPLFLAAELGHIKVMKLILDSTNSKLFDKEYHMDNNNNTILHAASKNGHLEVVQYCFNELQFDINHTNSDKKTSLHLSVLHDKIEVVKYIMSIGNNTIDPEHNEMSALDLAVMTEKMQYISIALKNKSIDMFKLLIDGLPCDLALKILEGKSSLLLAAKVGFLEAIQHIHKKFQLCDVFHNVHSKDSKNNNILHIASSKGHLDVVKYCIEHLNFDANSINNDKKTSLHLSVECEHLDIIKYLLTRPEVDTSLLDRTEKSHVLLAIESGNTAIFKVLIKDLSKRQKLLAGRMSSLPQSDKYIPTACFFGKLSILQYLIKNNICQHNSFYQGWSCLQLQVSNSHTEMVSVLLEKCDDYKNKDYDNLITYISDEKRYLKVLQLIANNSHLKRSSRKHSVMRHGSSYRRHSKILNYHNCNILCTIESDNGVTPLYLCFLKGHSNLAKYIFENFPSKPNKQETAMGRTYLHAACAGGCLNVAKILIRQYKLDHNATDANGITPLYIACESGHISIVKYLVEDLCIDVEHLTRDGKTYLHAACSSGNINVIKLIATNKKMDLNKRDTKDMTPLDIAVCHHDMKAAKYLVVGKNCEITTSHISEAKKWSKEIHEFILAQYSLYTLENNEKVFEILGHRKFTVAVEIFRSKELSDLTDIVKNCSCSYFFKLCSKNMNITIIEYHLKHHKCFFDAKCLYIYYDWLLLYAYAVNNINLAKIIITDKKHPTYYSVGILCFIIGCANSSIEIIQLLLQNKSWMNRSNPQQLLGTFMHVIAIFGDKEIFEYLIAHHNASKFYVLNINIYSCIINMEGSGTFDKDAVTVLPTTQNYTPFFLAIQYGSLEIIKLISPQHINLLKCDCYFLAIKYGHLNILKYLIHQLPEIRPTESPLFWACLYNQLEIVKHLLSDEQYRLVVINETNLTAMHVASRHGHLDLLEMLVNDYNGSINCKDSMNHTPLYFACMNGHSKVVKYLASLSWDDSYRDEEGNSYLHAACISGNKDVLNILINDFKSDVNCQTSTGKTPIFIACEGSKHEAVTFLLDNEDCNPNIKNKSGDSILHLAIRNKQNYLLNLLLLFPKVDVNMRNDASEDTPLLFACSLGYIDPIKALLQLDACNPHCKNSRGQNFFHKACHSGVMDVIRYLAEKFRSDSKVFNCQDQDGISPVFLACIKGYHAIVQYLHAKNICDIFAQSNVKQNCLHAACLSGNLKLVQYLSDKIDINTTDFNNTTPLHMSCRQGHLAVTKLLVEEKKCNVDILTNMESTILHASCESNNLEVIRYIIGMNHFDLNARDSDGYTPYLLACKNADKNTICYLEQICDREQKTNEGLTSLHVASSHGNKAAVEYFSVLGICDVKDQMGRTPLYLACLNGHLEVVKCLVEKGKCDLHTLNNNNQSCIYAAISTGQIDLLNYIKRKTERNFIYKVWSVLFHESTDINSDPLYIACDIGQLQIVKYLVKECSYDRKVMRQDELSPIHLASFKGHLSIVSFLVEECNYGIDECLDIFGNSPLHYAAVGGRLDVIKYCDNNNCCKYECLQVKQFLPYNIPQCLEKVYASDILNQDLLIPNTTALHCAAAYGHLDSLEYLIGSDFRNAQVRDSNDDTILHVASRTGEIRIVKYIVENNLLPCDVKGYCGVAPLHCASSNGRLDIVEYLTKLNKSYFLQCDNKNRNVLHYACAGESVQLIEYILNHSLSYEISNADSEGNTPLHYAVMYGNMNVVQLLIGSPLPDGEFLPRWCEPSNDMKLKDLAHGEAQYEVHQFLLQSEAQESSFKVPGSLTSLPSLNIIVLGSKQVGKTTLINTLSTSVKFEWLFNNVKVKDIGSNQSSMTTTTISNNRIGCVRFYEMMGDELLYAGYDSILEEVSNPLVIIVINLYESIEEINSHIRYWLKIILKKQDQFKQPIETIIVGSHLDSFDTSIEEKIIDVFLSYTPHSAKAPYFISCDCRYPNSTSIKELCSNIANFGIKIEQHGLTDNKTFVTIHLFRYFQHLSKHLVTITLGSLSAKLKKIISTNEILKKLCDLQVLHKTCLHLKSSGRIKYHSLRDDPSDVENNVVILNEYALLQLIQRNLMSDLVRLNKHDGVVEQSELEMPVKKFFPSSYFDTKLFIRYLLYSQFCSEISYNNLCISKPLTPNKIYYIFPGLIHFEVKKLEEILWDTNFFGVSVWCLKLNNEDFLPPQFLHALLVKIIDTEDKNKKEFKLSKNGALIVKTNTRSLIEISESKNVIHVVILFDEEDVVALVKQRSKLTLLIKTVLKETCSGTDYSEFLLYGEQLYPQKAYMEVPVSDIATAVVKGDKNIILRNEALTQISLLSILHKDFFDISGGENIDTLRNDIDRLIKNHSSISIIDESGTKSRLTAILQDEYQMGELHGPITFAQLYERATQCSLFTTKTIYVSIL